MFVDIARHAAKAYQNEGNDYSESLQRIKELFDVEFSNPTDEI